MKPSVYINLSTSVLLTLSVTAAIGAVFVPRADALLPDSKCVTSNAIQDSLSTFMCGPGGGLFPGALGSSNAGSPSGGALLLPASTSLLKTSPSITTVSRDPNCNMFITPSPNDAMSSFMCGPNGGSYVTPSLLNFPNLPLPAVGTPSLPSPQTEVYGPPLPANWPAAVSNTKQPSKAPAPTPTPTPATPTPTPTTPVPPATPAASPAASSLPVAPSPSIPATAPAPIASPEAVRPADNSKNSDTNSLIAIGIVFALILAGGLLYLAFAQPTGSEDNSDDEDA